VVIAVPTSVHTEHAQRTFVLFMTSMAAVFAAVFVVLNVMLSGVFLALFVRLAMESRTRQLPEVARPITALMAAIAAAFALARDQPRATRAADAAIPG